MQQIPDFSARLLYITTLADEGDTADWRARAEAELLAAVPDASVARVHTPLPRRTRLEEQSLALQCLRNSEFALEDLVLLFDGRVNAALTPEERAYAEEVQTQLHMALQKTSEGTNLLGSIPDPIEQQVGDAGEQNTEELLDQETERLLFRHLLSAKGVLGDLEDLHTQKIESAGTLEERADAENILIELRKPLFKLEEAWYWLGGEDMG